MMENDHSTAIAVHDDGRVSKRGRLMGKLFGRDRKTTHDESTVAADLNDFLHGSSPDKLQVAHASPPVLSKLDTQSATRYPNSSVIRADGDTQQQELAVRQRPKKPRKPYPVRFVETYPEVIGEGGDECDIPPIEVSRRKKQRQPPQTPVTGPRSAPAETTHPQTPGGSFEPAPLRRVQTGFSPSSSPADPGRNANNNNVRHLGIPHAGQEERRKSLLEIQQAQMREAEGRAFANAVRAASGDKAKLGNGTSPSPDNDDGSPTTASVNSSAQTLQSKSSTPSSSQAPSIPPKLSAPGLQPSPILPTDKKPPTQPQNNQLLSSGSIMSSPERIRKPGQVDTSPTAPDSAASANFQHPFASLRQWSRGSDKDYPATGQSVPSAPSMHDVVVAASEEAFRAFLTRTKHLFELFRLHAESVRPLLQSAPQDLARAALWWFLTGRTALEVVIRDRPTTMTPEIEMRVERAKQQAFTDLAKGYWLVEEAMPEVINSGRSPVDREAEAVRTTLVSSLKKLTVSMKRNDIMPPEELFLPQVVDRTIWLEYPQISQDIKTLLWGLPGLAFAQNQEISSGMTILETLPLGDSATTFCFARFQVEAYLMEQGRESQRLFLPCFLSTVRPQTQSDIVFILASQNGAVQLRISGNKSHGPVWDDVRWHPETCHMEVKLPRGFLLVIKCHQQAYSTLRSMYEFSVKVHSTLYPRQDENCIFRTTLRAFQYFDNDPQARQFPKESTPNCEVALFERLHREGAATGPRTWHKGYRIAVVTGPRTKTLSGVNHTYSPQQPIQFGFLRNESNDPALSLKFDNGRFKGSMVLSFAEDKERSRMHSQLVGTALGRGEEVFGEVPLQGAWFSERFGDSLDNGLKGLSSLPWTKARVINHDNDGDRPKCVLADRLRVVYEFKDGTFTDRINVAPGELKIRLDVQNPSCLMVFRQPQADATLAITEVKSVRDVANGLAQALDTIRRLPTFRTFKFPSLEALHTFQMAITGFKVLFDGIASAFAISRRRMVVPIHKKWEAGATRIQVVQQEGVVQILAFFEDFSHGQCMGFQIKGTDVFEAFTRGGGKAGLKIVDAKFPLPKVLAPEAQDAQQVADAAFLCLDLPELPGEHDDISIVFDTDAGEQPPSPN